MIGLKRDLVLQARELDALVKVPTYSIEMIR